MSRATCSQCYYFQSPPDGAPAGARGLCSFELPIPQIVPDMEPPGLTGGMPRQVMRTFMLERQVPGDRYTCKEFVLIPELQA